MFAKRSGTRARRSARGENRGRFLFDTANHTLYYSANGTAAAQIALAQVEAGVTVHPSDIHVVA